MATGSRCWRVWDAKSGFNADADGQRDWLGQGFCIVPLRLVNLPHANQRESHSHAHAHTLTDNTCGQLNTLAAIPARRRRRQRIARRCVMWDFECMAANCAGFSQSARRTSAITAAANGTGQLKDLGAPVGALSPARRPPSNRPATPSGPPASHQLRSLHIDVHGSKGCFIALPNIGTTLPHLAISAHCSPSPASTPTSTPPPASAS